MRLKLVLDKKITGLKQKLWINCENLIQVSDLEDFICELTGFEGKIEIFLHGFFVHHNFMVTEALKDSDEVSVSKSEIDKKEIGFNQVLYHKKERNYRDYEEVNEDFKENKKKSLWGREALATQVKSAANSIPERKKGTKQSKNLKKQMKKNPKMKEFSGTVTKFPKKETPPDHPPIFPHTPTPTPAPASEPVSILPHELKPGDQIKFTLISTSTTSPSTNSGTVKSLQGRKVKILTNSDSPQKLSIDKGDFHIIIRLNNN